jgi:hypothetical protein
MRIGSFSWINAASIYGQIGLWHVDLVTFRKASHTMELA